MPNQILEEAETIYENAKNTYYAYRADEKVSDTRLQRAEKDMIAAYNHLLGMRISQDTRPVAEY